MLESYENEYASGRTLSQKLDTVLYPSLQHNRKTNQKSNNQSNYRLSSKKGKFTVIGKGTSYTYTLLPRLSRYVNDGRINIDNNLIENAIRPLALGRKNWLFCGNDASAYRAAIVYSLIRTCKNAGIEPRIWMEDVLTKIPYYLRDGKVLSELLPRRWAELGTNSVESGSLVPNRNES